MSDSSPALEGGCLCGQVRFEIAEPLVVAGYCHCTRCQRRTGTAASASAWVAPGSFRISKGQELVRIYRPPDGFDKAFCEACGSALYAQNPDDLKQIGVRLGVLDADPGIRPSFRQFVAYAAPWEPIPADGLQRHPERRSA